MLDTLCTAAVVKLDMLARQSVSVDIPPFAKLREHTRGGNQLVYRYLTHHQLEFVSADGLQLRYLSHCFHGGVKMSSALCLMMRHATAALPSCSWWCAQGSLGSQSCTLSRAAPPLEATYRASMDPAEAPVTRLNT